MNASDAGMRMADTATVAVKFVTVQPADLMASKLIGTNVYNNQNESLGEIEDVVVQNGKSITGVVVSVGGFLGMGEELCSAGSLDHRLESERRHMACLCEHDQG